MLQAKANKNGAQRLHSGIAKETPAHRPERIGRVGVMETTGQPQDWSHDELDAQVTIPGRVFVPAPFQKTRPLHQIISLIEFPDEIGHGFTPSFPFPSIVIIPS